MYKILVSRTIEFKAPFQFVVDSIEDWSHFGHLHRKSIAGLSLLSKSGERTVFLYKARRLYPLPFMDYYLVFREDRPSQYGFRNVYINAKTGASHTLEVKAEWQTDRALVVGDHLFSLPSYWRYLPKFFMRLFLQVYKWRMDKILDEDFEWIYERMTREGPPPSGSCAPAIPESYDVLEQAFKKKSSESADVFFQYRVVETFDGKGRLRVKKRCPDAHVG